MVSYRELPNKGFGVVFQTSLFLFTSANFLYLRVRNPITCHMAHNTKRARSFVNLKLPQCSLYAVQCILAHAWLILRIILKFWSKWPWRKVSYSKPLTTWASNQGTMQSKDLRQHLALLASFFHAYPLSYVILSLQHLPPFRHPHSEQRRPARAHAVGPVLSPHARTDRTRDTRVAEPWLPAPEDGRPGEGQRLTPEFLTTVAGHPPRGRPPRTPAARSPHGACRSRGQCWAPTPTHLPPRHVGGGPQQPAQWAGSRGRDSA